MPEQTIYVNGYGPREGHQHTQLIMTDVLVVRLIKILAEALEIMDSDGRVRLTINHGNVRSGGFVDEVKSEYLGVITDAPRLK